jgi:hypothetical protein
MILEGFRTDVKTSASTKLRRRLRGRTTAALVRAEACAVRGGAGFSGRCLQGDAESTVAARYRSASIAAWHPDAAAVIACR